MSPERLAIRSVISPRRAFRSGIAVLPRRQAAGSCQLRSSRTISASAWVGPHAAGGIGERRLLGIGPGLEDGLDPGPCALDLVAAHEQGGVAPRHVHDQALIGIRIALLERLGEGQVQCRPLQPHAARARILAHQLELDALVRLQADDEPIGRYLADAPLEDRVRYAAEFDDDLGRPGRQPLAGADVERHPGPPPSLDLGLDGDEGLGLALVAQLLEIARHLLAADGALPVLAAHGPSGDRTVRDRSERMEDLELLVPDRIGRQGVGRLHGDQAEELQHVVLHHVPQRPGIVVVGAATLDADALRRR